MVFFRNVQLRWMPVKGDHNVTLALERPGASGDQGIYADRIELQNIKARFPLPDFSGSYKYSQDWGYVRAAGMLRRIKWDDVLADQFDLSGDATGWGLNLSSNINFGKKDVLRMQYVFGEGIQNYMNDSPVDIGIVRDVSNPVTPIRGEPIPITGLVLFFDHTWSEKFTSSVGYSRQDNDNTDGQAPDAFRIGQYALGNVLYNPVPNVMMGGELQWGRRENFSDGFHSDGLKIQFSFKYSFSRKLWRMTTMTNRTLLVGAAIVGLTTLGTSAQSGNIQQAVDSAYEQFKTLKEGKNADYIPALAKVDPNLFGIAVVTADGKVYTAGDVKTEVSIQSISKVFTMAQVIQEQGLEAIEKRIGVDATGARFNSIIAVEGVRTVVGTGAPEMNPLVNPGAISATSMVRGASSDEVWKKIIGFHNDAAGRQLTVLQDVYKSESDTNQRNQAIGALMLAYGYIKDNWQQAVDLYTRQCSIGVNASDLATMAATLAFAGKNPVTNKQVLDAAKVPGVLAVMATAGLYDDSGKWLYHTGLPAKSGVGGGIIAVSPGKFGIAVVSPPLDDAGNSVRAQRAIAAISNQLGGNPYVAAKETAQSVGPCGADVALSSGRR